MFLDVGMVRDVIKLKEILPEMVNNGTFGFQPNKKHFWTSKQQKPKEKPSVVTAFKLTKN